VYSGFRGKGDVQHMPWQNDPEAQRREANDIMQAQALGIDIKKKKKFYFF
jgi:hypothetical protein